VRKQPVGATIEVAGECLQLLPQRALLWPGRRMLLVADAHFGKAERFRTLGVAVPSGTTGDNLSVLDAIIQTHPVDRIVFLGDLTHGRLTPESSMFRAFAQWRERHRALELDLVMGNHDRHAGELPAALGITLRAEPHDVGPFSLCHHPEPRPGRYVLAGHVHPAVKLFGLGHDRVRTPCFVFGTQVGILPAFGAFTGGFTVDRATADRIYVIAGERVLALPAMPS